MVVALLVTTRLFGHAELSLAVRRLISFSSSLTNFPAKNKPREFEVHLQGSADWSDFWGAVSSCGDQLNLKTVRLDIDAPSLHEIYHATWSQTHDETEEVNGCWRAELPLMIDEQVMGRIEAVGRRDSTPVWRKIAKLAILSESFALAATQFVKPAAELHAHSLHRPHVVLQEMATR
jgi:UDP-GlcNAc:undecaprenyl-phosphate GlcNAc-1-phosphate transferase